MEKTSHLADRTEFHWRQVKKNGRELSVCRTVAFFAALALGHYGMAVAGPTGGVVTRGSGSIEQAGPRTDIDQASRRLDIDWTTFSTRAHESVNFRQPDRLSTAINRVVGGVPSELRGALNANGRVFIINRSGITFHQSSRVNVGALLATTAGRMQGEGDSLRFDGAEGAVINHGNINISDGGFALLVAPDVTNTGYIQADLGQVTLASGKGFSVDLRGDGLISFKVDDEVVGTVVNAGVVRARSGVVQLSAADAQDALAGVINMGGMIDADAIAGGPAGTVLVHGGEANVSGDISADGPSGGNVQITGDRVSLTGADVSASGPGGGGDILIGGDFQGKGATYRSRTTDIDAESRVRADATADGDGGYVIVWSDGTTSVHGTITARGGPTGGDGGFIETSGKKELIFTRSADASAPHGAPGTWLLDPENIDIGRGEADAIEGSLNQGNNVSVKTSSEGEGEGNIAVNASITKSEGDDAALSMEAHGKIDVNAPITSLSGKLDVSLKAASAVNVNSDIETNGGSMRTRVTGVQEPPEETESVEIVDETGNEGGDEGDDGTPDGGETEDSGALAASGDEADADEDGQADEGESATGAVADAETGASQQAEAESGEQQVAQIVDSMQTDFESAPAEDPAQDEGDAALAETGEPADPEPDLTPAFSLGGNIRTGGGDVSIEAIDGVANVDGVIDASNPAEGQTGGNVEIFADEVNLGSEAVVDVSGDAGGGTALIGGDYQGGGDKPTATKTTVAKGAEIRADATGDGDGGKIVVWADDTTVFRGKASARGGAEGGDGGFVEVSGKRQLIYRGVTDTRAPEGETGTLLLDPDRIEIAEGGPGNSATGAVDEGGSSASNVTIFEKDLEAQFADIKLLANKYIYLRNLDDECTATGDYDGILDIQATKLKLEITGSNGKIWFEDSNDTIRVAGGERSKLMLDGGTSNEVAIDVGNLEAFASGSDAEALVYLRAGGNIRTGDIEAVAEASGNNFKVDADAEVDIKAGGDITIEGDIFVSADAVQQDTGKEASANAIVTIIASGDANEHDSNARLTVTGDIDAIASAHGDDAPGVKKAQADAKVRLTAAGDVWVQGNGADDDSDAIFIDAMARASSAEAKTADAMAYLKIDAGGKGMVDSNGFGDHVDSNSSDNGGIRVDGDIVMDADAYLRTDKELNENKGGKVRANASTWATLISPDDVKVFDSNDAAFDGQSGILVDGDIDLGAKAQLHGVDDFDENSPVGAAYANVYLDVFAGSHSSGAFEVTGDLSLDAFAESLDVGSKIEDDKKKLGGSGPRKVSAFAIASADIYAADGVDIDGNIDVQADAVSAGAPKFVDPPENKIAEYTGGGRNGHAVAYAYLGIQAGVADPKWKGSQNSAAQFEHSSNADIRIGGNVTISADALYRGDGFADAAAFAEGFLEASRDITLEGDVRVAAAADAAGTGPVYRSGEIAQAYVASDSTDTYRYAYLADDAIADAYLTVWAGMHSGGALTISGDVAVVADAELHTGSMAAKFNSNADVKYLDRAEAMAYGNASFYAADSAQFKGENGISVKADALSSGEINGGADARSYLGINVGGKDPRWKGSENSASDHSHGSSDSLLSIDGPIVVDADAQYYGNAGGLATFKPFKFFIKDKGVEANAEAAGDLRSAGDIKLGGDINIAADADSVARQFENLSDIKDIDDTEDFFKLRAFYLGIGAGSADAFAVFDAYAGSHSNGTFDLDGTLRVDAEADVDSNATPLVEKFFENIFPFGGSGYAYLFMNAEADADADVKIGAADDIDITGTITGSANSAEQQAIYVSADARVNGTHHGDAKAEVEVYLDAGLHDSNGSVLVTGDVDLLADAEYKGDLHGSAEAKVYGNIDAAQDIVIDGDVTVHATARSSGTSDPYDNKLLGIDEFSPKNYRLADDADAKVYLNMYAGLHSSGSLEITGNIDVVADAQMWNGSFAWYERDNDDDPVEAEAWVEVDLYAADKVELSGEDIVISADAKSIGEFNGRAFARTEVDITVGGKDPYWKGNKNSASTHSHGSNGEILIEAERFKVHADADYSGNAYGHAVADADLDLEATEDIRIKGDVLVYADALSRGIQLDDPLDESNNFVYKDDDNKIEKRGDYLGAGDAKAYAEFSAYAGSHSSGSFTMDGELEVIANAVASSNLGDVDSNVSMLAYLQDKDKNYAFDKDYTDRGAEAKGFIKIKAADDLTFTGNSGDESITLSVDADVNGQFLEDAKAFGSAYLWAGYHANSDSTDNGDLDIAGKVFMSGDARYQGDAFGSAESKVYGKFRAARDITIGGDFKVVNHAKAKGTGDPYEDSSLGKSRLADKADGKIYLSLVAGTHSSGDLSMSGDIDVEGITYLDNAAFDSGNPGSADAEVNMYLYAADNIRLTGDDIAVTAYAGSVGELNGNATADVEFKLWTGDDDPLFGESHGSSGSILVDLGGGDVKVSAEAYYEGNAGGDAYADTKTEFKAAGDISIDADVTVKAKAEAIENSFDDTVFKTENKDVKMPLQLACDFDNSNWVNTRSQKYGVSTASASASFTAYAGSHSNGTFDMAGTLDVRADAAVSSNQALLSQYFVENGKGFPENGAAKADAKVEIDAADDIVISADKEAIHVSASADVNGVYLGDAEATADMDLWAGKHADSDGKDNGIVDITGDIVLDADAKYRGDKFGSAWAKVDGDIKAAGDIDIDGDVDLFASARAEESGKYDPNPGANDADAKLTLTIDAGTHSGGDLTIDGMVTADAKAHLIDGAQLAGAHSEVNLRAANDIVLTAPGDVKGAPYRSTAFAMTTGKINDTNDENGFIVDQIDILAGSNSPFGTDDKLEIGGMAAYANFKIEAGHGEHEGNSSAIVSVDGDMLVDAKYKFDGKAIDIDFDGDVDQELPAGALAFGYVTAAGDITLEGDITVQSSAKSKVSESSKYADGEAEAALAVFYGYAGVHSSGDYSHTGNLRVKAQAGDNNSGDPASGSQVPVFAGADAIIGAANDITINGNLHVTATADNYDAVGGASAGALLELQAALHGENSAQSGDLFVGGQVDVGAVANARRGDGNARARLIMEAADSHDGFDDDLTVGGPITVYAIGRDGGDSNDSLSLFAEARLRAGDDVVLNSGPPTVKAKDLETFGSNIAICGPGPCFTGTDSTSVGSGASANVYSAELDIFGHEGHEDPDPEIPEIPPDDGGGRSGSSFTPSTPPPVPPLPPELQEIVLRTVVGWLEAIAADPEYFFTLPPGLLEDIIIGEDNEVVFTQSFFDVIFPRIFNSDLRDLVPWPPELIDFLEASRSPPNESGPGDGVVMVTREDSS